MSELARKIPRVPTWTGPGIAVVALAVWSIAERLRSLCGELGHAIVWFLDRRDEPAVDDLIRLGGICTGTELDTRVLYLVLTVVAVGMALTSMVQETERARWPIILAAAFTIGVLLLVIIYPVVVIY